MQAGKVCATHPGRGALLRDTEKPWGRGSKVRRQSPPAASTTHNSRHAERLADCALRARALPAASSRLPAGACSPGSFGPQAACARGVAGRCGVAVPSRFSCLS